MDKNLKSFLFAESTPAISLGSTGKAVERKLEKLPDSFKTAIADVDKANAPKLLALLAIEIGGDEVNAEEALRKALPLAKKQQAQAAPAAGAAQPAAGAPVGQPKESLQEAPSLIAARKMQQFVDYLFESTKK